MNNEIKFENIIAMRDKLLIKDKDRYALKIFVYDDHPFAEKLRQSGHAIVLPKDEKLTVIKMLAHFIEHGPEADTPPRGDPFLTLPFAIREEDIENIRRAFEEQYTGPQQKALEEIMHKFPSGRDPNRKIKVTPFVDAIKDLKEINGAEIKNEFEQIFPRQNDEGGFLIPQEFFEPKKAGPIKWPGKLRLWYWRHEIKLVWITIFIALAALWTAIFKTMVR